MKKLILIMLSVIALSAQAQSSDNHWYGYPHDRQVSAVLGGVTGSLFYSVARSNMENEPKWKAMLISAGGTLITSAILTAMPNRTRVERRQNFTASMASGLSITLIFSLGI